MLDGAGGKIELPLGLEEVEFFGGWNVGVKVLRRRILLERLRK